MHIRTNTVDRQRIQLIIRIKKQNLTEAGFYPHITLFCNHPGNPEHLIFESGLNGQNIRGIVAALRTTTDGSPYPQNTRRYPEDHHELILEHPRPQNGDTTILTVTPIDQERHPTQGTPENRYAVYLSSSLENGADLQFDTLDEVRQAIESLERAIELAQGLESDLEIPLLPDN